tara:strand:+ start:472 stop:1575 length:1104 start_codon:yes stop_codon:yes gene_type:complete
MNIPITNPSRELKEIKNFDKSFINELKKGIYVGGNNVEILENSLKTFLESKYITTVNSGTDALYLSLLAMGIGKNDEVLVPSFTFFATVESILNVGATPVFVDIDEDTYCLDIEDLSKKITKKTKVIIPVHLFGNNSNIEKVVRLAKSNKLKVLEDAAQCFGSKTSSGKFLGTIGDLGAFSFYPSKTLGGIGDGGMIATNNKKYFEIITQLKNHGLKNSEHKIVGINSRLDSLNAFVLNEKLKIFHNISKTRNDFYKYYMNNLSNCEFIKLPKKENSNILLNYFTISINKNLRDELIDYLKINGISTSIYYKTPVHQLPALSFMNKSFNLDKTVYASKTVLSLPFFPFARQSEMERVVKKILNFHNA